MLKTECKELRTNCNCVAKGSTLEVVLRDATKHVENVHKDLLASMSPQELVDMDKTLTRMTH